jgi:3-hydroxyisobutyrate dehydrogenase-like beta-hydroxyacid dehydrogenase
MMQKDMMLALELGQDVGVTLPTTSITNDYLSRSRDMGLDHYDFAVLFDVLAKISGVSTDININAK